MGQYIYEETDDGEWFKVVKTGFRHMCCDCSKVHIVNMKVDKNGDIWMQWNNHDKASAAARRGKDLKLLPQSDTKPSEKKRTSKKRTRKQP